MSTIVAQPSSPRLVSRNSAPRPFVDDIEAARLAELADAAADALPVFREAVDAIVRASYEHPVRTRVEARRLVARVLDDLIRVTQGLVQPVPPYRKLAKPPALIVRRRRDAEVEGVEDLRLSALPAWASEVAR